MEKITNRQMYEAVIEAMETGNSPIDPETVQEWARKEIEKIDTTNAKARARAKAKAANDPLIGAIKAVLTNEFQTLPEIVAQIDVEGVTNGKVTARLTQMVNANEIEKDEVKVVGADGKTSKRMAYRVIGETVAEAESAE